VTPAEVEAAVPVEAAASSPAPVVEAPKPAPKPTRTDPLFGGDDLFGGADTEPAFKPAPARAARPATAAAAAGSARLPSSLAAALGDDDDELFGMLAKKPSDAAPAASLLDRMTGGGKPQGFGAGPDSLFDE
jgi:hypothetical protein